MGKRADRTNKTFADWRKELTEIGHEPFLMIAKGKNGSMAWLWAGDMESGQILDALKVLRGDTPMGANNNIRMLIETMEAEMRGEVREYPIYRRFPDLAKDLGAGRNEKA